MAGIETYLEQIKNAIYGREVRQAIHDGIHQCYEDGKAGAVDLVAREQIAELVAPSGEAPSAAEVTDARIGADGTTYTSLGLANRTQFNNLEDTVVGYVFGDNLRSVFASDKTAAGITFTVGEDTVTANGTATANTFIDIIKFVPAKTGKYKLAGAPSGGGSAKYIMYVQGTSVYDTGDGAEYTLNAGTTYTIRIIVYRGYTANNLVFTPTISYVDALTEYTKRVNGVSPNSEIDGFYLDYGAWQSSGKETSASLTRVCSQLFRASGTFTISLEDFSNYRFAVVQFPTESGGKYIDSGWKTSAFTVTVDSKHSFALNMSKIDNSAIDDVSVFKPSIVSNNGFYWHLATVDDVEDASSSPKWLSPKQYYYDHLFITDLGAETNDIIIPSESLANINSSYRLGFDMIEANVKALNDGNYIVCHGGGTNSSYFGTQFAHVDGTTDISGVAFADVSLSWVRTNVRYRAKYSKYATYPPTLQEFLYECKKYGMTALVQCVDANVAKIADEILGKNKWVAYNGTRNMTDGLIMEVGSYANVGRILSRCRDVGQPFMYCMGNTLDFTLSELGEIVKALHDEGYLIGYVQYFVNEAYNQRYKELGFDFCASSWSVNRIDNGNICNLSGDVDYSDFVTTGTVNDGAVTLSDGDTIVPADTLDTIYLGKGELVVSFEGRIVVRMGRHIYHAINSSDNPQLCLSTVFINEIPTFSIASYETTSIIKSITYKASKC